MRKKSFAIAAAAAAVAALSALPAAAAAAAPPKLLIVISVDQFSGGLFDEYRAHFTGGLARLAQGTVFRKGFQSHAATETCPGHSTILTGNRPARTGIIANSWYDPAAKRADKDVYCAEDESIAGTTSAAYRVSSTHLRSPTLSDLMKRAAQRSMNVTVAGKDRAAVMLGGATPDQRWYWDGRKFATDRKGAAVPRSVAATNAAVTKALAAPASGPEISPLCAGKAQVFAIAGGGKPIGNGTLARGAGDASTFRITPQFDASVLALAAGLVRELGLGADSTPDLLSVGLSATDFVGHHYGSGGQEMCLQLMSLDRDLGDFLALLDRWGLDYSVALTADHGALDVPERLRARGVPDAAWIDGKLSAKYIGRKAAEALGRSGSIIVSGGPNGDIYVDPALTGAERARAIATLVAAYRANSQVAAVFTKEDLEAARAPSGNPAEWLMTTRVRASFDPARSGDLYVVLKPHIMPITNTAGSVATHGSPWDYDRRVPILFWRKGMAPAARDDAIETVDIMPTLAAELKIPVASGSVDGHCLGGIQGVLCPAN